MKNSTSRTTRGKSQDRKLVSNQKHELRYEADKKGVGKEEIIKAKKLQVAVAQQ